MESIETADVYSAGALLAIRAWLRLIKIAVRAILSLDWLLDIAEFLT
jgi:hypothetical protein